MLIKIGGLSFWSSSKTAKSFRGYDDIDMNLLQVKSGITKHVLSRDLMGNLKPADKRHSLHYSHKRIRRPQARNSMPKLSVGKVSQ